MKLKPFYVNSDVGCCIRNALSIEDARRITRLEVGTHADIKEVREATTEDIAWVQGMGGLIPTEQGGGL